MTYNGWSNYLTWVTRLWIDADSALCDLVAEEIKNGRSSVQIADLLVDVFRSRCPLEGASVWMDYLNYAISEVNWVEIAESFDDRV